jgi:hypothetical protein
MMQTPMRQLIFAITLAPFVASAGCTAALGRWSAGGWLADYNTAEKQVQQTGRPLLILYQRSDIEADKSFRRTMKSSLVQRLSARHVRCRLFASYEPHRRYVAQFGVQRPPALIVVHRDGTYHARVGPMTAAETASFLANAGPPGAIPRPDPYLPRTARYEWHDRLADAEAAGQRLQRPVVIVFHRSLTSDWSSLKTLLSRHEVYSRLGGMVHCRIGVLNPWTEGYITRFGALRLPAIVLLQPDGRFDVLELPTSYESVVRFADAAMATHGAVSLSGSTPAETPAGSEGGR